MDTPIAYLPESAAMRATINAIIEHIHLFQKHRYHTPTKVIVGRRESVLLSNKDGRISRILDVPVEADLRYESFIGCGYER